MRLAVFTSEITQVPQFTIVATVSPDGSKSKLLIYSNFARSVNLEIEPVVRKFSDYFQDGSPAISTSIFLITLC